MSLSVRGGGDGRVQLRNVTVAGPLGSFFAPAADLSGTFSVTGASARPTITLGSLTGSAGAPATLASAGDIRSLTVISAARHARVLAGTNFGSDGVVGGAPDSFGSGSIFSLKLRGAVAASLFAAGLDPVSGAFGDEDDRVVGGAASAVRAVLATAGVDADTRFIAGGFGTARLPSPVDPLSDPRFLLL